MHQVSFELDQIFKKMSKDGYVIADNISDVVKHEYGHRLTMKKLDIAGKADDIGLSGISTRAEDSIAESMAEIFVKNEKNQTNSKIHEKKY